MSEFYLDMDKDSDKRSVRWQFVVYPESLPNGWLNLLVSKQIPCCISPLHDRDYKMNSDGTLSDELVKPHYHINFEYDAKRSFANVQEDIQDLCGYPYPKVIRSPAGANAYLTHSYSKDKAMYDEKGIITLLGYPYEKFLNMSPDDVTADRIVQWAINHNIYYFGSLSMWCLKNNSEWARVCRTRSFYIKTVLQETRFELVDTGKLKFDEIKELYIDEQN